MGFDAYREEQKQAIRTTVLVLPLLAGVGLFVGLRPALGTLGAVAIAVGFVVVGEALIALLLRRRATKRRS